MEILLGDVTKHIRNNEVYVKLSNSLLRKICKQLGYKHETFSNQMTEDFGFFIEPDDYVDLSGLAVFVDDIGLDSNTFFDNFIVDDIQVIDDEDGAKTIGITVI